MDDATLDNFFWHALSGRQARFAAGDGRARRFAAGLPPICAFDDNARADLAALAPLCLPGEGVYVAGWSGTAPAGWRVELEATMFLMGWQAPPPGADPVPEAVALTGEHLQQALALAARTRPGPIGERSFELGDYYGLFDGPRLVAMAGERAHAGPYREISGVCTDPLYQGRGLARRLIEKLAHRQQLRGEVPVLHVMRANTGARGLYESMGFRNLRATVVRVISRAAERSDERP